MRPLNFTNPVTPDKSIHIQEEKGEGFYPHLHQHKEAQLIWIKEGSGTLVIDNSFYDFKENDIFMIAPQQAHVFKSTDQSGISALSIFYDPEGNLLSLLNLPELSPFNIFLKRHQGGFKVPDDYVKTISRRMEKIKGTQHTDQIIHFMHLLRSFCQMNPSPTQLAPLSEGKIPEQKGSRIEKVYNFIVKNFRNPITLDEVAASAHLTPQAFCRYFKKHTGTSFVSFLNELRINEACKDLTAGRFDSISEIAYQSGFSSIANFNRVFKSIKGSSPKEYLSNYIEKVNRGVNKPMPLAS